MLRHAFYCVLFAALLAGTTIAKASPSLVFEPYNGTVFYAEDPDKLWFPASLTKMMTLYVAFDAIERGEISLDTKVTISRKAAAEQPSKLGLKPGQRIQLRYLIRAAAIKSANDAATAIAEAISGSEAAFARRMNRMAKAMGMSRTTFRNAHGLTESGHLSTARDMTILGRHVFYDFPEYYNLFSRRSTSAGIKNVSNTNRRLLNGYRGADGIKTGYTRAAGYNLVASAERGQERIIATVFGGRSTAWRTTRIKELLDMGFDRAPSRVAVRKPARPVMVAEDGAQPAGKILRTTGLVARSLRPLARPGSEPPEEVLVAMRAGINDALLEAAVEDTKVSEAGRTPAEDTTSAAPQAVLSASLAGNLIAPPPRPRSLVADAPSRTSDPDETVVVTRMSTSGGRHWAINVGRFASRHEAEKMLLKTALVEVGTLDEALRKVVQSSRGYEATFVGLSEERAALACRRLEAQNVTCTPMGPS